MASRFQTVQFDDFTEAELQGIWIDLGDKHTWNVDRKATSKARTVRKAFLRIASDAVVAPRPDRQTNAELHAAMAELDELIGLAKVKQAEANYDRELKGLKVADTGKPGHWQDDSSGHPWKSSESTVATFSSSTNTSPQ